MGCYRRPRLHAAAAHAALVAVVFVAKAAGAAAAEVASVGQCVCCTPQPASRAGEVVRACVAWFTVLPLKSSLIN